MVKRSKSESPVVFEKKPGEAQVVGLVLIDCAANPYFGWMIAHALRKEEIQLERLERSISRCEHDGLPIPQWVHFAVTMGYQDMLTHIISSALTTGKVS